MDFHKNLNFSYPDERARDTDNGNITSSNQLGIIDSQNQPIQSTNPFIHNIEKQQAESRFQSSIVSPNKSVVHSLQNNFHDYDKPGGHQEENNKHFHKLEISNNRRSSRARTANIIKKADPKEFKCSTCLKIFQSETEYNKHCENHSSEFSFLGVFKDFATEKIKSDTLLKVSDSHPIMFSFLMLMSHLDILASLYGKHTTNFPESSLDKHTCTNVIVVCLLKRKKLTVA